MTWFEIVIKIVLIIVGIAAACIITLPKLRKAIKERRNAKTAEEKAKANAAIKDAVLEFIGISEKKYESLNAALKNINESGAGLYKKDNVLSMTRDFCDEHGYEYNKDEVSDYIEKVIDVTQNVNKN